MNILILISKAFRLIAMYSVVNCDCFTPKNNHRIQTR